MDARQLVVLDRYVVDIEDVKIRDRAGAIAVRVRYSGVSAGTELSVVKGTNVRLTAARWSPENKPDLERLPALVYPVRDLGYMEVGDVVDSEVAAFPVGATVALACGHQTAAKVVPRHGSVTVLPDDIDPLHGIWVSNLLPICANGLLHAAAEFDPTGSVALHSGVAGRRIVVVGAGVIGLILAYWAAQLGGEIIVVDRTEARLKAARALGLDVLLEEGDAAWAIRSAWRNSGPDSGADLVFQTRGTTQALVLAVRSVRPGHPVIDLAFYQTDAAGLHLGEDFHHSGVVLRAAQIGNIPRTFKQDWSRSQLVEDGIGLLRTSGALLSQVLVTDVVPFEDAPRLLMHMANDRSGRTLQAVFSMER